MLDPKVTRRMEELVLGHTTDAEKAQILGSLQDLERSFKSVPPYLEWKGAMATMGRPSSRPATPSKPPSRPPSRPCTPTRVPNGQTSGWQEELYEFSKVNEQRFPSQMHYETSRLPVAPPYEEPPPPPVKTLKKDLVSQVYFPGNPGKQKTTYQESFQDRATVRTSFRDTRPSSAVNLARSPSIPAPDLQSRPSTAGGCRGDRQYFGTTLSPRMFDSLRKRQAPIGGQVPPPPSGR